jgi:hypothetical protein
MADPGTIISVIATSIEVAQKIAEATASPNVAGNFMQAFQKAKAEQKSFDRVTCAVAGLSEQIDRNLRVEHVGNIRRAYDFWYYDTCADTAT